LALQSIIDVVPDDSLHFIAVILPEAIIGTKEANEKAREAAYDLLIQMGKKMQRGGTVRNSMIDGMEDMQDTKATLDEYFVMVSAGLAGTSQHMISATITALSRMLYGFKGNSSKIAYLTIDDLSSAMLDDLLSTMELFLTSKSREIARSAIGFMKVALVSLPKEHMEGRLEKLIPNLMVWSHETKGHFRVKVKNLMERLIRRFGYDAVAKFTPEEDRKLLVNIRKSRERKKRGKAIKEEDGDEDGQKVSIKTENADLSERWANLPMKKFSTAVTATCQTLKLKRNPQRKARKVHESKRHSFVKDLKIQLTCWIKAHSRRSLRISRYCGMKS